MAEVKTGQGLAGLWRKLPTWAKVVAVLALFTVISRAINPPAERPAPPVAPPATVAVPAGPSPVEACVERGMAYFSSLGSYPKLSDGRDAIEVARERCSRDLKAF